MAKQAREIRDGDVAAGGANCMFGCPEWCGPCAEQENSRRRDGEPESYFPIRSHAACVYGRKGDLLVHAWRAEPAPEWDFGGKGVTRELRFVHLWPACGKRVPFTRSVIDAERMPADTPVTCRDCARVLARLTTTSPATGAEGGEDGDE